MQLHNGMGSINSGRPALLAMFQSEASHIHGSHANNLAFQALERPRSDNEENCQTSDASPEEIDFAEWLQSKDVQEGETESDKEGE